MINYLFIDVPTKTDGTKIYHRLKRLKSTISINRPINYVFGTVQPECIITLYSTMTEDQLDEWLYKSKSLEYDGSGSLTAQKQ